MIQMRTILEVADNSGARKISCIHARGNQVGRVASLGDIITANVKEASPDGQVKKGAVVKAVIVRTKKEYRRRDGTYIRFDDNAAVLIDDEKNAAKNAAKLRPEAQSLMHDATRRQRMSDAALALGKRDAADAVAQIVIEMTVGVV